MGEQPFAVAAWIVASAVLYYILEDKLGQIIDLGKPVDCYRWFVVCLTGARCKDDVLALLAASEFRRKVWR